MDNILTFRVAIEGLENKIYRTMELTDRMTVADLAYTILASFNSLAYHLYKINHNGATYISGIGENFFDDENATTTRLKKLDFEKESTLIMEYDFGSPTKFVITYQGSKKREPKTYGDYPIIIDGAGSGMLDDMSSYTLQDVVAETDKLGYSNCCYTPGYETNRKYDYRKYNIKTDNKKLKGLILEIKNGYEVE